MKAQYTSGTGFAVKFSKKAQALIAGCRNGAHLEKKLTKFRMLVPPTSRAYIGPKLGFFCTNDADSDSTGGSDAVG